MEVKINKEIRNYTESMFFGLSLRQFIFSVLACGVAVGLYFLLRPHFGTETLSWVCILGAAPFALMGFVKYNGKLTRIITLEMLSDTFDKKSFPELDEMSGQVYSTIVLRFAKEISYRVYDEFDNTQISTEENGDLIVSVEMPEDEWLIGYLLSFGTQVDIVEPAHLKDIVAKQAKSIYEKYKS